MSTTSPCCWCDPLPCRQALDRSRSQSKLRYSPRIGKKSATDPGILLSFSSSEKPQKRRKRSHTNVSDALVARSSTPPAQTPQRSFQQASAGLLLSSANRLICLKYAEGAPHTARGKPFPKRFQITLAQTSQRSFQGAAAGTHATPAPNRAHSGTHGETRVFRMGWYYYPRSVPHVHEHPRAGYQNGVLCRFWVLVGDAPEGVAAPLGCVIPLLCLSPH